jgi:hypothetical protein
MHNFVCYGSKFDAAFGHDKAAFATAQNLTRQHLL